MKYFNIAAGPCTDTCANANGNTLMLVLTLTVLGILQFAISTVTLCLKNFCTETVYGRIASIYIFYLGLLKDFNAEI